MVVTMGRRLATSGMVTGAGSRVLVDQRQDAQAAPITRVRLNEVEAPDMVSMLRPQAHA